MTAVRIVVHILFLYGILFIGDFIQEILKIPIPGSVIGMLLFFLLLKSGIVKLAWIQEGTSLLLRHLTLFFIPVTVGFIEYLELFSGRGLLLLLTAVISTALVMGISGLVSDRLARRREEREA